MRETVAALREHARSLPLDDVRRNVTLQALAPCDVLLDELEAAVRTAERALASGSDVLTRQPITTLEGTHARA